MNFTKKFRKAITTSTCSIFLVGGLLSTCSGASSQPVCVPTSIAGKSMRGLDFANGTWRFVKSGNVYAYATSDDADLVYLSAACAQRSSGYTS